MHLAGVVVDRAGRDIHHLGDEPPGQMGAQSKLQELLLARCQFLSELLIVEGLDRDFKPAGLRESSPPDGIL